MAVPMNHQELILNAEKALACVLSEGMRVDLLLDNDEALRSSFEARLVVRGLVDRCLVAPSPDEGAQDPAGVEAEVKAAEFAVFDSSCRACDRPFSDDVRQAPRDGDQWPVCVECATGDTR